MSIEKNYYVYVYRHPKTRIPFYVGKGRYNRIFVHLNETYENTENHKKYAVIKGLLNKGLKPLIGRYAKNLDEETAYDIEEQLIAIWGRRDIDPNGILTNICANNRPPSHIGRTMLDTTKRKIGDANRGENNGMFGKTGESHPNFGKPGLSGSDNGFFGKTHTQEVKDAIIAASHRRKGKFRKSDELKEFLSKINRNTWLIITPEGESIEVDNLKQFCKDRNMIKSAAEILQRLHRHYVKTDEIISWHGWYCQLIISVNHTTLTNQT